MDAIFEGLRWLGLDWDEGPDKPGAHGPYFQSERLALYSAAAEKLLVEEKAYRCFCDPEALKARREAALARGAAQVRPHLPSPHARGVGDARRSG